MLLTRAYRISSKLLLASVLLLSVLVAQGQDVGQKAPDFTYYDTEDNPYKLSTYLGKVVFLFTFGNTCDICHGIGPDTETRIQQVYGHRNDFQALGLDTWDHTSNAASIGAFRQRTGISFPLLMKAGSFERLYATTYDRVIIIDQEGYIRHKNNQDTKHDLDNAIPVIEELLQTTSLTGLDGGLSEGLSAVFPNPVIEEASVQFSILREEQVRLDLYNSAGRKIKTLTDSEYPSGVHKIDFPVAGLSPGLYFLRMETESGSGYHSRLIISR
jgi:peroxiredoxin